MRYIQNCCTRASWNMAFDEHCLQQFSFPVFYLWRNAPSVIIGLNQNPYAEVNLPYLDRHGILLARRVTGGGAVYHDLQNLNYSIIRPVTGNSDSSDVVQMVAEALRHLGVPAELSGRNDILVGGRKVSGYARRVWCDREMIHGTLMFDVDIDTLTQALNVPGSKLEAKGVASVRSRVANLKDYLPQCRDVLDLQRLLQAELAGSDGEIPLPPGFLEEVTRSEARKFGTWEWNFGHSPEAGFRRSAKLGCGEVTALLTLDRGCIRSLGFTGDFIGALPAADLARRLTGLRYERKAIAEALAPAEVSKYFDGAREADILELLIG